jgi:hypothetical protein
MQVTLKLWVSNQAGVDSDCTANYIEATRWQAPSGVTLDTDAQTLAGEAEAVWTAYRSLAKAVAGVGHGLDDAEAEEEAGQPTLTACPEQLVCEGYTCAAESLARLESPVQETWAGFVASVPSLAKEIA